jgi:hypothetical protein
MNAVYSAALELQSFCRERNWRFCFIGGVALQRWGEPRQTVDVDVTLLTGFGEEESFVDPLLSRFVGRRSDAREFALQHRVLLLENAAGVGLDVALGGLPFEAGSVERASAFSIGDGQSLFTCSAEDLIVHKCFANRGQDWVDVENILVRQQGRLDVRLIRTELAPLVELKQEPAIAERLDALISRIERQTS